LWLAGRGQGFTEEQVLGLDQGGEKGTLLGAKRGEEPFKEREQHVQSGSIKTTCPFGKSRLLSDVVPNNTEQGRVGSKEQSLSERQITAWLRMS